MNAQAENIRRVSGAIGQYVITFCHWRVWGRRPRFYVAELESYVRTHVADVAPGSPCRILRDLRQRGILDYRVVSRRESLYEVLRA